MRERDDCLHAARMNLGDHLLRRFTRIEKLNIRTGLRSDLRFLQRQAEHSNLHAIKLAYYISGRVAEWLAGFFINHVGDDPLKLGFLHTLAQHLGTKVKLVIAKGCIVETGRIPGVDHLRALVGYGFNRRRNGISGKQEQSVWRLLLNFFLQSQYSRQAAARSQIDWSELIDVVHLQQGYFYDAIRLLLCRQRNKRREHKDKHQRQPPRRHCVKFHPVLLLPRSQTKAALGLWLCCFRSAELYSGC